MGLWKLAKDTVKDVLADEWLEMYESGDMGDQTVFTEGIKTRKGQNVKGNDHIVSNGSVIHVYDNQFMMVVDGGKIVDYTTEPGYYKVDNSSNPSLFNGNFPESLKGSIKDAWERYKFAGESPREQKVYYINLQEIKGIKFGTRNPINYFDTFYNAELFIRAHGTYSVKIVNPIQFYAEAIPRNKDHVEFSDISEQYVSEFLQALQSSINQMSADGIRVSHVTSKAYELGKYMANVLDEDWNKMRGMEIQAVGIASVSYDEKSQELIEMRNQDAIYSNPDVARGYMVRSAGEAMKSAASNESGAMHGILGMGMSMNASGNMVGQMITGNGADAQSGAGAILSTMIPPAQNQSGAQYKEVPTEKDGWTCECGAVNTGKFCSECGKPAPAPANTWTCECGAVNTGKFCPECGKPAPVPETDWKCECGTVNTGKFCSECGKPRA